MACWICDCSVHDLANLKPRDSVARHVRYGGFLPSIPRERRVGDFVHGACRVTNAIVKRLMHCIQVPGLARKVNDILLAIMQDSKNLPKEQRVHPKVAKTCTLDLTAARVFLESQKYTSLIVDCVKQSVQTG